MIRLPPRFLKLLAIPLILVMVGTVGYHLIEEQYSLFDGLYMTVITLSTIGYGETHPLSTAGRAFTICLILGGVSTFFYAASEIIRAIVSGEIAEAVGKQAMERELADLKDHVIVCGYGRMGRMVCREFSRLKTTFVVIDASAEELKDFKMPGGYALVGDAASDDVLKRAGIERARSLVTVMASDASNLYTTMSARLLNSKCVIVARVEDTQSEPKLVRAGATRVVSPYQIGGARVAHAVLKPTVVDFIDLTTRNEHLELQMEEVRIAAHSSLAQRSLIDSRLRLDLKIIIVAIKKRHGHMVFNPEPETILEAHDILIAIGNKDSLDRLGVIADPPH
jgi:voltage-gated potassium channel